MHARHIDSAMWVETYTECHIYYDVSSSELPENKTIQICVAAFYGEYTITTYDANGVEIDSKYMSCGGREFEFTQKPHYIRASGPKTKYCMSYSSFFNSYNGCNINWQYDNFFNENKILFGSDKEITPLFRNENALIAGESSYFQQLYNIMFDDIMDEKTHVYIFGCEHTGTLPPNEFKRLCKS